MSPISIRAKDCPFCGGFANTTIRPAPPAGDQAMDEVMVYCTRCHAKASDIDHAGVDQVDRARDVLKRWNRRVNPAGFKP